MIKNIWKNIQKGLGTALIGVSLMMPVESMANSDLVLVRNFIKNSVDDRYTDLRMGRAEGATNEFFDIGLDIPYSYVAPPVGAQWMPKITTHVSTNELSWDWRSTNSFTDFNFDLSVVIKNNQDIIGTNKLGVQIYDTLNADYIPLNENWTINYDVKTNYYTGGAPRADKRNLRELCPVPNLVYYWTNSIGQGVGISIPKADTNSFGEVVFGTGTLHKEYNKLVSSSFGNGVNSPEGSEIVNYNSTNTVSLNANVGGFVDKFIVTRTDSIGNVAVTTNDIIGQNVSSTNVVFPDLKGSNSIYAVYGTKQFPVNVATSGNGMASPTNATVLYNGFMTVVFSAGTNSLLEAIVDDGITNMTFNPATNNYNYTSGAVTNDKTIRGIFDLKKFFVSTSVGANGTISSTNAVVPYGSSTNINVNAAVDYKIAGLNTNGVPVPAATGLESYVAQFSNVTNNQTLGVTFNEKLTTNGIPHTWLTQYGITNKTDGVESVDSDKDGFNTLGEYTADTNPTNSSSYYRIGNIGQNINGMFVDIPNSSTNRQYGLKSRTSLSTGSWQNFTNGIIGNGNTLFINLGNSGPVGFFQGTVGLK